MWYYKHRQYRTRYSLAQALVVLLPIACVATEREVPVRLDIVETDTVLLPDSVLEIDPAWLGSRPCLPEPIIYQIGGYRPDCFGPTEYGLMVNGRIVTGACDSLTARAMDKEEDGTHYVTLDVRTIANASAGCGSDIAYVYDATIEVLGNRSPTSVYDWVVSVYHDDVAVPWYE